MAASASSKTVRSVAIEGFEVRTDPSPHIVYAILVKLPVQSWKVYRRYSEFDKLVQSLQSSSPPQGAGKPPPAPLPPKKKVQQTWSILARSSLIDAQKVTAGQRLPDLRAWLKAIVDAEDDAWRLSSSFRDFLELPKDVSFAKHETAAKSSSSSDNAGPQPPRSASKATSPTPAPGQTNGIRRLGQMPHKGVETDQTRALDNAELLGSRQAHMDSQDDQLNRLGAILRRQKEMGMAINHELAEQSEMLQDLDTEVEGVQGKMSKGEQLMKKLEK